MAEGSRSPSPVKLRRAFVCGWPVSHSRSPLIHRHWLQLHGIEGSYDPIALEPERFADFLSSLPENGFCGGNITLPHKEAAFRLIERLDEAARRIEAVNTVWIENGVLHATNTDWSGFAANLDEGAPGWDRKPENRALVIGAGGAARAIIHALLVRGFEEIIIANRTEERAQVLAAAFGSRVRATGLDQLARQVAGMSLLVNTTTLGMHGEGNPEIQFSGMQPCGTVTDAVYVPLETPFLTAARQAGIATVDGLGMLLHQAVPGFEKWFGIRPQVTPALRQLVIEDIGRKE